MGEPLIVVSTLRVKQGRLEDVTRYYKKILELIEANEAQLIAFHGFLSEDGTEISSVQVHPRYDLHGFPHASAQGQLE